MELHNLPQDWSYSYTISRSKVVSPNVPKFTTVAWSCKHYLLEHWLPWDTPSGHQFARSKTLVFSILLEDYIKFNVIFSGKRGPLLCEVKTWAAIKTFSSTSAEQELPIHNMQCILLIFSCLFYSTPNVTPELPRWSIYLPQFTAWHTSMK